jgi:hypothetical protein
MTFISTPILFIIAVSLLFIAIRNQPAIGKRRLFCIGAVNISIILFIGVFSPDLTTLMLILILLLIVSVNLYLLWKMPLKQRILFCISAVLLDYFLGFFSAWAIRGFPPG